MKHVSLLAYQQRIHILLLKSYNLVCLWNVKSLFRLHIYASQLKFQEKSLIPLTELIDILEAI